MIQLLIMSERNFFSLRYALPGYTFILIMILVAYPSLIEMIKNFTETGMDLALVSALLAFFTLLGGSAIGFLISQFWYFSHNSVLKKYSLKHTRKFLRETFNLKENAHQEIVFLDYVFHNFSKQQRLDYVGRRFDLLHTLASTLLAVIFGVIFGIFIKTDYFSINVAFTTELDFSFPSFTMYDCGITIIIIFLLIVLSHGFFFIRREHSMMVNAAIKDTVELQEKFTQYKAEKIFSEKYFLKKVPTQ